MLNTTKHTFNTVVVAAALNYGPNEFRNFIVPLRRVYNGNVVLFVRDNLQREVVVLCSEHRIQTRPLPQGSHLGVKGNRYVGYAEACEGHDWCFATDFRDVFFQADPFASIPAGYDLILAEEFAPVKIKTCPYNSNWIKTCWGQVFLDQIGDQPPVCSGTIMGTPTGLNALKAAMLSEMKLTSKKKGCTARDQGHLNYLYFAKKLPVSTLIQPRGRGIVNTVGYITPRKTIIRYLDEAGLVSNVDGSVSAVIHQYDRFPELVSLLQRLVEERGLRQDFKTKESGLRQDLITNKKYLSLCDVAFKTRSRNDLVLPLKSNAIVCVQGVSAILDEFFRLDINTPFTLITIENDESTPQNIEWLRHKQLKTWYSWNSMHPDVIPIPIGLNEDSQLRPMIDTKVVEKKIEMLLVNFKQDRADRRSLYRQVEHLPFVHVEPYQKRWGSAGALKSHYEAISAYKWVLCPRGAGEDTHRLWETLYLGSIPVVLKSSLSSMYEGLPVIQLDSWGELSLETLKRIEKTLPKNRSKAYFDHWASLILSQKHPRM